MRITYIFTRLREKKNIAHQDIILEILREIFFFLFWKKPSENLPSDRRISSISVDLNDSFILCIALGLQITFPWSPARPGQAVGSLLLLASQTQSD